MEKVFLNSLPKSGTNLLAKALDLFGFVEKAKIDPSIFLRDNLKYQLRRFFDRPKKPGYIIGINHLIEVRREFVNRILEQIQPGEYCIAHVGYSDHILHKVLDNEIKPILMIRDPRAVVASLVPYMANHKGHVFYKTFSQKSKLEQYDIAFRGYRGIQLSKESLYTTCVALDPWYRSASTLIVRFEDLIGPKGGGSDQIQQETISKICDHVGGLRDRIEFVIEQLFGPGRSTFRKGQVNSWKSEIPTELQSEITRELEPFLKKWGYKP